MRGFSIETILPGTAKLVAAKLVASKIVAAKINVGLSESNKSKL